MHKLLIMDPLAGHQTVEFAPPNVRTKEARETRKRAKEVFDEVMQRPGWAIIAQAPAELEGKTLKKFDPRAQELIAVAPTIGG